MDIVKLTNTTVNDYERAVKWVKIVFVKGIEIFHAVIIILLECEQRTGFGGQFKKIRI